MQTQDHTVRFNVGGVFIDADVSIPADATGIVLFVHGSAAAATALAIGSSPAACDHSVSERC